MDQNEKYEDKSDVIDNEIRKRYYKWHLHAIAWFDFDDVAQIIRAHIFKKWDQWDQARPLEPWVNKIISNQLKNILRNNYSNFARPCLNCEHNQSKEQADSQVSALCALTPSGLQCNECDLFAKWEKTKKSAYEIKIPLALEDHSHEVCPVAFEDGISLQKFAENLHEEMRVKLKSNEWMVYKGLFIENKSEEEVAKSMGFKSNEKNRTPGYKQIKNLRKKIIEKVKKCLQKDEVDYL